MRPTQWRRSTHIVIGVAVVLVVAAVVVAAALLRGGHASDASAIPAAPAPATADPGIKPVSDAADKPTPDKLAATLALTLADPNLGAFTGRITDAATGEQLWAQGADVPMQPASVTKVLTTAAALHGLDRDARLTTKVLASNRRPGLVVLKGGGDPTLSAVPKGQDTWYRDAARISDLADQVRRSGTKVTAVAVDVSAYSGPTMAPGWDPLDIDGGDIAPMESVMLDGGRTQPVSVDSARSKTPALDAGRALAVALRVDPATVTVLPSAVRRRRDRVGAVAAVAGAVARDDEQLGQRDGRIDRPGSRCRARETAKFRGLGSRGARRAGLSQDRHRWITPGGLQRPVRRRSAHRGDA